MDNKEIANKLNELHLEPGVHSKVVGLIIKSNEQTRCEIIEEIVRELPTNSLNEYFFKGMLAQQSFCSLDIEKILYRIKKHIDDKIHQ